MQDAVSQLAARAVHAADAVRDLVATAEELAAVVAPPLALYPALRALEAWAERLRGGDTR